MTSFAKRICFLVSILLATAASAHAHVGSKDVFETLNTGPYKLYVTIRMPNVIPGIATIEVESSGAAPDSIHIAPTPLTGEASLHPPTPDAMLRDAADPNHYTGTLWIMASGSWEVRFDLAGSAGAATGSVPVPAAPLAIMPMGRGLGALLAVLGCILMVGFAGLVAAAVRESRLPPGTTPTPEGRRRASAAFAVALVVAVGIVALGGWWWHAEARGYAADLYRPSSMKPTLQGDRLQLEIGKYDRKTQVYTPVKTERLLLDHGKVMHLYAIRWPQMDAAFHLHPAVTGPGLLAETLPIMPPGDYRMFADIVYPSGFPETLSATLTVPAGLPRSPLAADDASAAPPPLSAGTLGPAYKLPDGYTLRWSPPATLVTGKAYLFHFELLDPAGHPASDTVPYLGMAGHAAFVKTDATVFAHTHPDGSAAMPAMMLANGSNMAGMESETSAPIPPSVDFPYGFPSAGRYRIFIQMKHGTTVETGVFDAEVK